MAGGKSITLDTDSDSESGKMNIRKRHAPKLETIPEDTSLPDTATTTSSRISRFERFRRKCRSMNYN